MQLLYASPSDIDILDTYMYIYKYGTSLQKGPRLGFHLLPNVIGALSTKYRLLS